MKANRYIPNTGESCSNVAIHFTVTSETLEVAVAKLIYEDNLTTKALTKSRVEREITSMLKYFGLSYLDLNPIWGDYAKRMRETMPSAMGWLQINFADFYVTHSVNN